MTISGIQIFSELAQAATVTDVGAVVADAEWSPQETQGLIARLDQQHFDDRFDDGFMRNLHALHAAIIRGARSQNGVVGSIRGELAKKVVSLNRNPLLDLRIASAAVVVKNEWVHRRLGQFQTDAPLGVAGLHGDLKRIFPDLDRFEPTIREKDWRDSLEREKQRFKSCARNWEERFAGWLLAKVGEASVGRGHIGTAVINYGNAAEAYDRAGNYIKAAEVFFIAGKLAALMEGEKPRRDFFDRAFASAEKGKLWLHSAFICYSAFDEVFKTVEYIDFLKRVVTSIQREVKREKAIIHLPIFREILIRYIVESEPEEKPVALAHLQAVVARLNPSVENRIYQARYYFDAAANAHLGRDFVLAHEFFREGLPFLPSSPTAWVENIVRTVTEPDTGGAVR